MKKSNAYVVVNCGELPSFGGEYKSREEVFEHYNDTCSTFTGRVFLSLRAAKREMNAQDKAVKMGECGYVVCGVYCAEFDK